MEKHRKAKPVTKWQLLQTVQKDFKLLDRAQKQAARQAGQGQTF